MDDSELTPILNYRRVSEHVATGGQPTVDQLRAVARAGCRTVINLGLHDADYALPDERGTVESLGMKYVHIPVRWDGPTRANLERFSAVMAAHEGQDVFVHCAANKRVTVFVALDRFLRQGWPAQTALRETEADLLPPVWRQFIADTLGAQGDAGEP